MQTQLANGAKQNATRAPTSSSASAENSKTSSRHSRQSQQRNKTRSGGGAGGSRSGAGSRGAGGNVQVFAAPVVLRPPSRHRPRRPPKTATGVSRSRKGRSSRGTDNLDLAYRQRPSTAGGLGGSDFKAGSKLLQITPMFKDASSRAAMGDSVFNFQKLADADGGLAKIAASNNARGRRRRKASGGSAGGASGRRGARGGGKSMAGQSPRLSRGQIGQTGMPQPMQQQGMGRGGMVPTVPGSRNDRRGRGRSGGGRSGVSPRMQRISKVR